MIEKLYARWITESLDDIAPARSFRLSVLKLCLPTLAHRRWEFRTACRTRKDYS